MMSTEQRMTLIRKRLQQAFHPSYLEIVDESAQHKGHQGAENGAGHYSVIIVAECLNDQSRVAAHRKIYHVLHDLIPNEIHALKIHLKTAE